MTFALGSLRHVVDFCPERMVDRLSGILMERLPQKLRTEVAPSDPCGLPTAFHHGGHPGVAEQVLHRWPALSDRAQGGRQTCRIDWPSPRQRGKQGIVLMRATQLLNLMIKLTDGL